MTFKDERLVMKFSVLFLWGMLVGFVPPALADDGDTGNVDQQHAVVIYDWGLWENQVRGDIAKGDLHGASLLINQVVARFDKNPDAWMLKAEIHEKRSEYTEALESLERVRSVDSGNMEALEKKALILYQLKDYAAAMDIFKEKEELSGRLSIQGYRLVSKMHFSNNECDEALYYLDKANSFRRSSRTNSTDALMISKCLGGNSRYIHGDINIKEYKIAR